MGAVASASSACRFFLLQMHLTLKGKGNANEAGTLCLSEELVEL
jgi:hypothetical protein